MPSTYEPIQTTTLGSAQSSVTFTSFSGYTDLKLIISGSTSAAANVSLRYNNDTGSNYSETYMLNAGSSRDPNVTYAYLGTTSTAQGTHIVDIMNYSNTTTNKTALSRSNDGASNVAVWVSLWRNISAITTLLVSTGGAATWSIGTSFTLYGIKAA
jgi:hypothetical protein